MTIFGITEIQFFELVFSVGIIAAGLWVILKIVAPRFYVSMQRTQTNLSSQALRTAQEYSTLLDSIRSEQEPQA